MPVPDTVKDYMSRPVVTLKPDMDVLEAVQVLLTRRISGAPVVDNIGNLVGMLSEKDCMRVAMDAGYHGNWGGRVADYMHRQVEAVDVDASIFDIASRFLRQAYRRYPVMKDNRLVGQISRRDVLRALAALSKERA
jgi:predicted transcriptional regulator